MTTENDQNEPLDLTEDMQSGDEGDEQPEQQEDADEYTLEVEGEEADDDDSAIDALPEEQRSLPKKLRERLQTEQREKHDLQRRLAALEQVSKPKPVEVGDKPTLEGCDWDGDKFEADLTAWHERKRAAENIDEDHKREQQAQQDAHQKHVSSYLAKKAALPVPAEKKDAAEKLMAETLPLTHQNALLMYADDPAKVAVVLANSPSKLAALAGEKDPIRFALAIQKMEGKIVVNRRKAPAPESASIVRGSAPVSGSTNKTLEKLEAEAAKTGDRSKLIAARARLRAA